MRRPSYFVDEAGGVFERATGQLLGRVDQVDHPRGGSLYWPLDARGVEVRRATMIRGLAVLAIVRHARPGLRLTILDVDE